MKVQVLMENTSQNSSFLFEHGLSLYIESDGKKILFDTGQSENFAKNAETFGIDLKSIDYVVLSHGHYDHGGGLLKFLEINHTAPIYMREDAFIKHYNSIRKAEIGLDAQLLGHPQIHFTKDVFKIQENMVLYSCNQKERKYPSLPYGLCKEENKQWVPDDFLHEQYLEITENEKRILFSGCSHKGILNITSWFKPDILIGGFHLMKVDTASLDGKKTLREISEKLLEFPTQYYTCHCTGIEQFKILKTYMGDRLEYLSAGSTILI